MGGRQETASPSPSVGERFAEERERLVLSRAELAHACGYSSEQIRKVEIGERMPGGELLAAVLDLGGDIVYVLSGSSAAAHRVADDGGMPTVEEMHQARVREQIRAEARQHTKLRADRRKKVLTEEEADLIETFRELSGTQREKATALITAIKLELPVGGSVMVNNGDSSRMAGRDLIEGSSLKRKK